MLTKRRFAWVDDQENAAPANGDRPAPTLADFPAVLDRLRRADGEDRFEPTRALQQLITASDAPCTGSKVVEAGALPELVKSMRASPACALEVRSSLDSHFGKHFHLRVNFRHCIATGAGVWEEET